MEKSIIANQLTAIKKNTHKKFITYLSVECGARALNVLALGLSLILLYSYGQNASLRPAAFARLTAEKYIYIKLLHHVSSPSFSTPSPTCCACIRKPATGGLSGRRRSPLYYIEKICSSYSLPVWLKLGPRVGERGGEGTNAYTPGINTKHDCFTPGTVFTKHSTRTPIVAACIGQITT